MAKTNAALAQAITALQGNRKLLQTELDAIDRALAALSGIGSRRATRTARRTRRKAKASPRQLAALKKARAARKRKRAAKFAGAAAS